MGTRLEPGSHISYSLSNSIRNATVARGSAGTPNQKRMSKIAIAHETFQAAWCKQLSQIPKGLISGQNQIQDTIKLSPDQNRMLVVGPKVDEIPAKCREKLLNLLLHRREQ